MKRMIIRANERGLLDKGWLQSNFLFSFSAYRNPVKKGFGTLKVMNDDFVAAGEGFGIHPHANMEIISVMLAGNMSHKDSMGYDTVVKEDWVQIMSAGQGLFHEEYNVGEDEVNFLQIWIEPRLQNIPPRYQRRHFPKEKRQNQIVTVVSQETGMDHCWINQDAKLSLGLFEQGYQVEYEFNQENKCLFVYVISGEIVIGNDK